mmetsp:Transcript_18384/g.27776  ORF Transcript_18384/g.27776 Transcript_18384/m.27776 type:complete len:164 (-) Transcript_18384:141-632(-)|eukprot:CAMPEP_0178922232 /NCGR_PEP_ID=MMETSP0786-20121207/16034_1 /TAXON_ID=186022 /ORGANISM="Thalassionema frauenfeldii, Strain CCMP 1798" /LENGTH=163 /DNA_ID=CAMNT_0020596563 /DNA_START=88 /DNA_END=579 /DNA_ORIENTATION=+
MSSADVNEWDNEYARLARVASQLRTRGHVASDSDHHALMNGLSRLGQSLGKLDLPAPEIQRRRRLISHLQQNPQLAQQDEMIDDLAIGVERLKQQSQIIGDEAKLHLNLLSDMESNVDIAHQGLEGETRRAEQLRAEKAIWKLQMTVVGLSILLILLILTGLT